MKVSKPSIEMWKELYELAIIFKDMSPWKILEESDIFGIQNPANAEIGFCSVMGSLGEHHAISVYLGPEGLESYLKIRDQIINQIDAFLSQISLSVSYEDKDYLKKTDLEIINKLGIKIKGKHGYPMFRFHSPGYDPEDINSAQAQYLITVLKEAIKVVKEADKDNEYFLDENGRYPVLYATKDESKINFIKGWSDNSIFKKDYTIHMLSELELTRIKKESKKTHETWVTDYFYLLGKIKEKGQKPYYPRASILLNKYSEIILNFNAFKDDIYLHVTDALINAITATATRPKTLEVRRIDLLESLSPICKKINIEVSYNENLSFIDEIKEHFEKSF